MAVEAVWPQPVSGPEPWNRVIYRDFSAISTASIPASVAKWEHLSIGRVRTEAEQGNNRETRSPQPKSIPPDPSIGQMSDVTVPLQVGATTETVEVHAE